VEGTDLVRFYESAYSHDPETAMRYSRWRALSAVGKADHVTALAARAGLRPRSVLDVGCGDGALLSELHRRGFGGRLSGVELSAAAVAIASSRSEIASVQRYDGRRLPAGDGTQELAVISHVLEHVADPPALLREAARVCRAVLIEVPLEANLSARRRGKRAVSDEIGHLQRLDRDAMRRIVASAGLRVVCELDDPLPLRAHSFFATSRRERSRAFAKWALRATAHRLSPALARRLFTVHYACLCVPDAQPAGARGG
jgi:SAM-dependent methyltransferase